VREPVILEGAKAQLRDRDLEGSTRRSSELMRPPCRSSPHQALWTADARLLRTVQSAVLAFPECL